MIKSEDFSAFEAKARTYKITYRMEDDSIYVDLFAEIAGVKYRVLGYGIKSWKKSWNRKMAQRLAAAWVARAFYKKLVVLPEDPAGHSPERSYVTSYTPGDRAPVAKRLSSDLKRLGF